MTSQPIWSGFSVAGRARVPLQPAAGLPELQGLPGRPRARECACARRSTASATSRTATIRCAAWTSIRPSASGARARARLHPWRVLAGAGQGEFRLHRRALRQARRDRALIVNYELAPASTLDAIADSAIAGMDWTLREIGRFGGDPRRVSLSGHSAGGHLGAEILAEDWAARGLDPAAITGAVLISGIFDPAPTMLTSVNAEVRLTAEIAARRNVEARPPVVRCPRAGQWRARAVALDRPVLPLFAPPQAARARSRGARAAGLEPLRHHHAVSRTRQSHPAGSIAEPRTPKPQNCLCLSVTESCGARSP